MIPFYMDMSNSLMPGIFWPCSTIMLIFLMGLRLSGWRVLLAD